MIAWETISAVAIGGVAAAAHLAATGARARICVRGGAGFALATAPLSITAPALCLWVSLRWWPQSAYAALFGFWLMRSWTLARLGRP